MPDELSLQTQSPQERGYPEPEADLDLNLPAGGGLPSVPHFVTFSQLVNYVSRTYRFSTDEAIRHCYENAMAMRREPVIFTALRKRQLPVCQLSFHIDAQDPSDTPQEEAAKALQKIIENTPGWQQYKRCLLESVWYGKYAVQNAFAWDYETGRKRMVIRKWWPVNGDKLHFKYDGRVGVLVHGTTRGDGVERTDRGLCKFLNPQEREAFVVSSFEPEDSDFFEGDLAGAIHGTGLRGRVYWLWWMRNHILAWMLNYLERVGAGGLIIYYYEHGNNESLKEVRAAAERNLGKNTLLFPRYRDNTTGGPGLDRFEPSMAGAELIRSLVMDYFDNIIRDLIQHATSSGELAPGSGAVGEAGAELHAGTFARVVKYDATDLADTLNHQLVKVLNKYNYPGNPCPKLAFDVDLPNADEVLQSAKIFYDLGGEIDEDELRQVIGLGTPMPGNAVLSKIKAQAPVPLPANNPTGNSEGEGQVPEGIPFEGPPGPVTRQKRKGRPILMAKKPQRIDGPKLLNDPASRSEDMDYFYTEDDNDDDDPRRLDTNDWYEVRLPISKLTPRIHDWPEPTDKDEIERAARIRTWAEAAGGLDKALSVSPIILRHAPENPKFKGFEFVDGWHRAAEAQRQGLSHLTALVGFPKGKHTPKDVAAYHEAPAGPVQRSRPVRKARPTHDPAILQGFLDSPSPEGLGVLADHLEEQGHPHSAALRDPEKMASLHWEKVTGSRLPALRPNSTPYRRAWSAAFSGEDPDAWTLTKKLFLKDLVENPDKFKAPAKKSALGRRVRLTRFTGP